MRGMILLTADRKSDVNLSTPKVFTKHVCEPPGRLSRTTCGKIKKIHVARDVDCKIIVRLQLFTLPLQNYYFICLL